MTMEKTIDVYGEDMQKQTKSNKSTFECWLVLLAFTTDSHKRKQCNTHCKLEVVFTHLRTDAAPAIGV